MNNTINQSQCVLGQLRSQGCKNSGESNDRQWFNVIQRLE